MGRPRANLLAIVDEVCAYMVDHKVGVVAASARLGYGADAFDDLVSRDRDPTGIVRAKIRDARAQICAWYEEGIARIAMNGEAAKGQFAAHAFWLSRQGRSLDPYWTERHIVTLDANVAVRFDPIFRIDDRQIKAAEIEDAVVVADGNGHGNGHGSELDPVLGPGNGNAAN